MLDNLLEKVAERERYQSLIE
jgi:hypothetical protein